MTDSLISEQNWSRLCTAHKEYKAEVSCAYDEVLHEVSERIAASGSIGKLDIGALVLWKRLRAGHSLGERPHGRIRAAYPLGDRGRRRGRE